jgi:hypothetical protein
MLQSIAKCDSTKEPIKRLGPATTTIPDLVARNIAEAKEKKKQ